MVLNYRLVGCPWKATKLRGNLQLSFSNNANQCDDKYIFARSFKVDPSYSSKSRRIFFTGRKSEKFSCLFLFLPKFLVLGPIRPVPIVPGNFWLFEQLSEVLVASSNFLPFWAIFEVRAHIKHKRINDFVEKFYFCEILQRIKRGFSSLEND